MPPKGFLKQDLCNVKFNNFTVLALSERLSSGANKWECQCICGKIVILYRYQLKNKESCGCSVVSKNDIARKKKIGIKSGRLTCLSFEYSKKGNAYFKYQCDCGNTTITQGNSVKAGSTQSCGCLFQETRPKKSVFLSNGQSLKEFIADKDISMTHAFETFKRWGESTLIDELGQRNQGSNQSALERFFSQQFTVPFFNKKSLANFGYRSDFKLSDDIFLNVDGLYHHSDAIVDADYHFLMRRSYESEGKRLLQFYEDEIYNQCDIVKSIVNNALGKTDKKIFARKCELKPVDTKDMMLFFAKTHLKGGQKATTAFGLYYQNELVSCLSYRKYEHSIKIARFASATGVVVVGGFQKLLSKIETIAKGFNVLKIESFCDLRYATGKSYEKAGFDLVAVTQGWNWTYGKKRFNRLQCTAGNGISEAENAAAKNWRKIYDAGQAKYVKTLTL